MYDKIQLQSYEFVSQAGRTAVKIVGALVLALMFVTGSAFAQAGSLGLFADPQGTDCAYTDNAAGLMVVHVVHSNAPAVIASQFAVEDGPGFTGLWLSDTVPFPVTVGSTHGPTGIAMGYGNCLSSPIHVMSVNYFAYGTSVPCSWMKVIPPPDLPSGNIEVVDCGNNLIFGTGGTMIVNPTEDCVCDVPADETTWGAIKAMYHE
jgi:hypothetical protein